MRSMFKYAVLVLSVVVMGQLAKCQEAPRADRVEIGLLVADAASRGLDVYSTHRAQVEGYRELTLPECFARHPAAMEGLEGLDVAGQYWLARRLEKRGHWKLARAATLIDFGADLPSAVHNLYLAPKRAR
jgi:hypothetical protein